jgi:large subunit ribosomal protein L21
VQPEQTLDIDRLAAEAGAMVEFREVLLVGGDGGVQLGSPLVEGARVVAEVLDQGRDRKFSFKYRTRLVTAAVTDTDAPTLASRSVRS